MTAREPRLHPQELRAKGIEMYSKGMAIRTVADTLGVSYQTVRYWVESATMREAPKPKTVRQGSGVIAPSPYRKNYRWGLGKAGSWV